MTEQDRRVVKRFKELIAAKADLHEVRVFGSRARGDAAPESDLDVLVIVDHLDHELEKYISECAWEAGFPEDIIVVPITLSVDALQNSPLRESVFIQNVYREGVAL